MFRRFEHFEVLCTAKYRYGEKILHRKIKFYLRTGKNRQAGPNIFVKIRVANLGDFSPKSKFWDSFEKHAGHF
jgi:hypothetical protein